MQILICDDSGMARKQLSRALPTEMGSEVIFAENGREALEVLSSQHIDLLLLDLTMPVMDGYQTLTEIRSKNIDCMTIVVSGDIQPEAQQRVMSLGALAFLKKPVDCCELQQTLSQYGLRTHGESDSDIPRPTERSSEQAIDRRPETAEDSLREIANVAMGQAADKLARLFGAFINLPIPKVAVMDRSEMAMTLNALAGGQHVAVSQGFVGRGLSAEALLSTDLQGHQGLQALMKSHISGSGDPEVGALMDAAAILTGAFLTGFGKLIDTDFSKSQPVLISASGTSSPDWQNRIADLEDTLSIEIPYHFEVQNITCDLLILFPGPAYNYVMDRVTLLTEH